LAGRDPAERKSPPPRSFKMTIGRTDVHLLGCIKGLTNEAALVAPTIIDLMPDLIGLHIGPEELLGLGAVLDGVVKDAELSSYERLYALRLSRYGEVQVPPPSLVQALRTARGLDIPVEPLDMDDAEYSDVYAEHVGGITMIRQSLRFRKVGRTKFDDPGPEEFCIHWDGVVNRPRGFRALERERERRMAKRISSLAGKGGRQLHVLEYERMEGIQGFLSGAENPLDKIK